MSRQLPRNPVPINSGAATAIAISAVISGLSIIYLLSRAALAAIRPRLQGLKGRKDSREAVFFQTQLGYYAACLLLGNLISSTAGVLEFVWAARAHIEDGLVCDAQGALMQIGDFSTAYFTALIALHTFLSLVLHRRHPLWFILLLIGGGWTASILSGAVALVMRTPRHGPVYSSVGLFCLISSGYTVAQFTLTLLPMFISAGVISILYALIFLCLRGTVIIGRGITLNVSGENAALSRWASSVNRRDDYRMFLSSIIRCMLWNPFVYIIFLAPMSVTMLMKINGLPVGFQADAAVTICYNLLGLANVIILYRILRVLRPAFSASVSSDSESFFVPEVKASPIEPRTATIVRHGRSFPAPLSLRSSMDGSQISVLPRPPPVSYAGDLQHVRSDSSISSTSTANLMRSSNLAHSRSSSRSTIVDTNLNAASNANQGGNVAIRLARPIVPCTKLNARFGPEAHPIPPPRGLPAPPRPSRTTLVRRSLMGALTALQMHGPHQHSQDQNIPTLEEVSTPPLRSDSLRSVAESATATAVEHTEVELAQEMDLGKSRLSSVTDEEYEIRTVDSRTTLRPSISAFGLNRTAATPSPGRSPSPGAIRVLSPTSSPAPVQHISPLSRTIYTEPDMPRDVTEADSPTVDMKNPYAYAYAYPGDGYAEAGSDDDDSIRATIRARAESEGGQGPAQAQGPGQNLSQLAWASLVAQAAFADGGVRRVQSPPEASSTVGILGGQGLGSPAPSFTQPFRFDSRPASPMRSGTPIAEQSRRGSERDIPASLRPGTPLGSSRTTDADRFAMSRAGTGGGARGDDALMDEFSRRPSAGSTNANEGSRWESIERSGSAKLRPGPQQSTIVNDDR